MNEFTFKITKHIGTIARYEIGWNKEVNLVSWNGKEPKLDIRDWDAKHERMTRGISLKEDETKKLIEILKTLEV